MSVETWLHEHLSAFGIVLTNVRLDAFVMLWLVLFCVKQILSLILEGHLAYLKRGLLVVKKQEAESKKATRRSIHIVVCQSP